MSEKKPKGEEKSSSKRDFLKVGAGVAIGAVIGGGIARSAAPPEVKEAAPTKAKLKDPIRIGGIWVLSGAHGGYGEFAKMGGQLAIEEINQSGGIFGSKLEFEVRDDTLKPPEGVKQARSLVETWGADFLIGVDSSGVALAIGEIMPELGKVFIATHAATHRLTEEQVYKRGIKQIFRISVPVYQDGIAAAYVAKDLPVKKWANIGADYEYGYVSWDLFRATLKPLRPDVAFVESAWAKFGTTDFSPQITKVMAAEPDGIYTTEWAGEAVSLVKQAKLFGVFDRTKAWMCPMGGAMDVLEGLGKEYPQGAWISSRYWFQYPPTNENQAFVDRFSKRWTKYPHYVSETTYSAIYALKLAIEKAQSTDTDKVIKALEGMAMITPAGRRYIRPEDHQAVYEVPWGRVVQDPNYSVPVITDMRVMPAEVYYRRPPFPEIKA